LTGATLSLQLPLFAISVPLHSLVQPQPSTF
jgi:hypothetical protein